MKDLLGLAPLPRSVERNLSGSALGKQVRAQVELGAARLQARLSEGAVEPPLLRLTESGVAEELACLLDITRPDVASWSAQMASAIEQEFTVDTQLARTARHGLHVATLVLTQGPADGHARALAEFDSLLHALCSRPDAGGRNRG